MFRLIAYRQRLGDDDISLCYQSNISNSIGLAAPEASIFTSYLSDRHSRRIGDRYFYRPEAPTLVIVLLLRSRSDIARRRPIGTLTKK